MLYFSLFTVLFCFVSTNWKKGLYCGESSDRPLVVVVRENNSRIPCGVDCSPLTTTATATNLNPLNTPSRKETQRLFACMSFSAGPQLASVASASGPLSQNDPSGSSDHSSTANSRSSTVSPPSIDQNQQSQQVPPRPLQQQLQVQQTSPSHPYRNILTHQERKKLRMPKRKADAWPASILGDPDVLSLDDEGRFVLCKVCHVHYAVHGGKKPKPVIMNSSFRTRAWDVHKERTNSHRMQKKQGHLYRNHDVSQRQLQQQQHSGGDRGNNDEDDEQKDEECKPSVALDAKQKTSQSQQGGSLKLSPPPSIQISSNNSNVQPSSANMEDRRPPQQQQQRFASSSASAAQAAMDYSPLGRPSSEFMSPPPPLQSPRRRVLRPNAPPLSSSPHHQWGQSADSHDSHRRIHSSHAYMNAASAGPPPQASSSAMSGGGAHGKKSMSSTSEQRDGMMRWRNMHEDVSRALGSSIPSKRPASDQYANGDLRISSGNTMMLGETEDFGGSNEKVAKKLKSLDEEYDAKTLKRPEIHFDRRSASYKQYWGTLRDVYTASNHHHNSNKPLPSLRRNNSSSSHRHHQSNANASNNTNCNNMSSNNNASVNSYLQTKDSIDIGEATTPDDTGSSEDSMKTVVVHDQALVNAIDRLTGIMSKQLSDRYGGESNSSSNSSATVAALTHLTTAVTELRVQQDHALGRIIELQEQRLQVMEAILQYKLRKESEAHALLEKLRALDTDVHFRSLVLKCKCDELQCALRYTQQLDVERANARLARLQEETQQHAEHQQMQDSIHAAIERAREIRESIAATRAGAGDASDNKSSEDDDEDVQEPASLLSSSSSELNHILTMAKHIRTRTPTATHGNVNNADTMTTTAAAASSTTKPIIPSPTVATPTDGSMSAPSQQIRIEYPRRMKMLMEQLHDVRDRERHESFRFAFFRKMSERLSMRSSSRLESAAAEENPIAPLPRVQIGFPKQVARLRHGYTHVGTFLSQRMDPSSEKFQHALQSSTLSTLFPVYTRLKQAKKLLKVLNEEAKAFAERAPPPPSLSPAAIAHRDSMLQRIAKRSSTHEPSRGVDVNNRDLILRMRDVSSVDTNLPALDRLQAAWDASQEKDQPMSDSVFDTTVKDIVLTDTSNIILTFFKTIFCDTPDDDLDPIHVRNMLLLIRLVDSIAMSGGRRLRSAVSA
ncbi:hypothetical protein FI667_g12343, partial [Globisporangium splendens]